MSSVSPSMFGLHEDVPKIDLDPEGRTLVASKPIHWQGCSSASRPP